MNKTNTALLPIVGCILMHLSSASAENAPTAEAVAEMKKQLAAMPADPRALLPELKNTTLDELRKRPHVKALLERAESEPLDIPVTTYTEYRAFKTIGDRAPYQRPYFDKRWRLNWAVVRAWLTGEDDLIPTINDFIWNICEETNWVLPAHESFTDVDLMATETASTLATVDLLLCDRLPDEIRQRLRREVKVRVFDRYLDKGDTYTWAGGGNNWTGVCAGSIGEAALILETDPDRRAKMVALAVEQERRYLDHAFQADGASSEGIGYWQYGLSHFVCFAEMLRIATDGKTDLLADPKMKKIAAYPAAVAIGRNTFFSYSDSKEDGQILPYLAARLAERTGVTSLLAQIGPDRKVFGRLPWMVRSVLWYDGSPPPELTLDDVLLPSVGIARRVERIDGNTIVLAAKAGTNGESHNHNDVGTFVLRIGDVTYLCDPGHGLYDNKYFTSVRYENVFAGSQGHSVPRIGGATQKAGPDHRGTIHVDENGVIHMQLAGAYGLDDLKELHRTLAIDNDGTIVLEDTFQFTGDGQPVTEKLMTWLPAETHGATARIRGKDGVLEIKADRGTFRVERLEEACKANKKDGVLSRLTVVYPAAASQSARLTMRYQPAAKD